MSVRNLHTILSGKWLITDEFANSLYPYLINIINKGELPNDITNENNPYFVRSKKDSSPVSADEKLVVVLPVKGAVMKYDQRSGNEGTQSMMKRMEGWKNDDRIAGVLLDIDSGGGQVAGTREFADYISKYPKPVVAYTDGLMCSGAYYLGAAANKIFAHKYADAIGSIGVLAKFIVMDGYFEKQGAKVVEAYASKSTHKNKPFREATKDNLEPLIKEVLDPINEVFHSDVKSYRPQLSDKVLNGKDAISAVEAKELGLIDTIGDKSDAIKSVFKLANNNQNHTEMSEAKKMENLSNILGEEIKISTKMLSSKKGAFLSEEHLVEVERCIKNIYAEKEELKAEKLTLENRVTELENQVSEYGSQPGEVPTGTPSKGDRNETADSIVNPNDEHVKLQKEIQNEKS